MASNLLSVKITNPTFSNYISLDTFLLEKDTAISSPVIQILDFDIYYFSSDNCKDIDHQIIGSVQGYVIDLDELLRSFKERDHVYVFDFESLGEDVSDIYTYFYDNSDTEENYKKIYLIKNITLTEECDKSFIYQPIYMVITNTIRNFLGKEISHVCEFIDSSLFISYKSKFNSII